MAMNQPVDLALVGAYLHNLQLALVNDQPQHAELLLAHALRLLSPALTCQHPAFLPIQFSAGVGLDPGKKRRGKVYGSIPRNRGKNMPLIAALSRHGMTASLILNGSANGAAFEIYVEQVLAPSLTAGQIVVMDNLSIHKGVKVRSATEARDRQLLFLPSYSPDLSPMEEAFSKLKSALRCASARTREALEEAICQAMDVITAHDALG